MRSDESVYGGRESIRRRARERGAGAVPKKYNGFGSCLALEIYVHIVVSSLHSKKWRVRPLLDTMVVGMERMATQKYASKCLFFRTVRFWVSGRIIWKDFDKSGNFYVLRCCCGHSFFHSQEKVGVDERCIEALQFLLASTPTRLSREDEDKSHMFLGLCYFQKSCSTGRLFEREIVVLDFKTASKCASSWGMDITFVLEKGILSKREHDRVDLLPYV